MLQNLLQQYSYEEDGEFIKIKDIKLENFDYKRIREPVDKLKEYAISDDHCIGFTDTGMMKFYVDFTKLQPGNNVLYIHKNRLESYLKLNNQTNIPKKIHFIWFSRGKAFNLVNYIAVKAALYHNPDYEVFLHCDALPKDNIYYNALKKHITTNIIVEPYYINKHHVQYFQHKADYVRLNVLKEMGGIYLDTDIILLRNLDKFLNNRFVMCSERPDTDKEASHFLCNAVIMCEPNNDLVNEWIHIYENSWGEDFIGWWMGHSVIVPSYLRKKYNYMMTILPNFTFYPFLWNDLSVLHDHDNKQNYDYSHGIHLWDTEASKTNLLPKDLDYFKTKNNAFVRLFKKHVEDLLEPEKNQSEFLILECVDSPGDDIEYISFKSLDELKHMCKKTTNCIGFNTLGYLKSKINLDKLVLLEDTKNNVSTKCNLYILKNKFLNMS